MRALRPAAGVQVSLRFAQAFSTGSSSFPASALSAAVSPSTGVGSGKISGTVTEKGTHTAIGKIEVCATTFVEALAEEEEYPFVESCANTNSKGEYTLSELVPGEYEVVFFSAPNSGLDYVLQFYKEAASYVEAETVTVGEGVTRSGIDASLERGGEISGTVTSASKDEAIPNIEVCAFEYEEEPAACATTEQDGDYVLRGLTSGEYEVVFLEPEDERNYAPRFYDESPLPEEAEAINVLAPDRTAHINAKLVAGGEVTGKVISFSDGAPLGGIGVCAIPLSGGPVPCAVTDTSGEYDLKALGVGEYIIGFGSPTGEYAVRFYNEAATVSAALPVAVPSGDRKEAVDAELRLGPPQRITRPTISGSAVEGQTLTVHHATWTGAPTAYHDEWGRCAAAAQIATCHTVGEGESYALTPADVGHAIRVRETATNAAGPSEITVSAPTAAVTEAPRKGTEEHSAGSSAGPSPSPPAPVAPQGQVLSNVTSLASAAELKEMLVKLLVPAGKNAKINALLKHDGYSLSFSALANSQITVSWYLVPRGAHLASAKPTLVARGAVSPSAAGTAKIVIRLTGPGRALLKHASELKLTAQGSVVAIGGASIGATAHFVLRR